MRIKALLAVLALSPLTSACMVASAANAVVDVATLPVKVAAKTYDLATTSQAEADQKRGREIRKQEEAAGKAQRDWEKKCRRLKDDGKACPPPPDPLAPIGDDGRRD